MEDDAITSTKNVAQAMAEALKRGGVTSDEPECAPNPPIAAFYAYCACYPGKTKRDWDEFREWMTATNVPPAAYYLKLAQLCLSALRGARLNDSLRESVTYAWGYFLALSENKRAPTDPGLVSNPVQR